MGEYKTIRVPASSFEVAKAAKHDDETWGDFLNRAVDASPDGSMRVDTDALAEEIAARLESNVDASVVESAARDGAVDAIKSELR